MGYQPLLKNTTSLFLAKPPLNRRTVQVPPFEAILPLYWFSVTPSLKSDLSVNPQNIKPFKYIKPSYLLKVTKFLGKISQFKFLVMTEKNIFAYKLLSLNISDFNLFLM